MPVYRSAWLLPVSQPPIRDAWVHIDGGRIVAFGPSRGGDFAAADEIDLGDVIVLPGLVNAHTHLELSWMRGRIPPIDSFTGWIRQVIALRAEAAPGKAAIAASIESAIDEARRHGTVVIGDISNTLASSGVLRARGVPAHIFHELLGFPASNATAIVAGAQEALSAVADTDHVRHTLSPHAPYSVSPALFDAIRGVLRQDPFARSSVHLAESQAEIDFLRDGSGPGGKEVADRRSPGTRKTVPARTGHQRCTSRRHTSKLGFAQVDTVNDQHPFIQIAEAVEIFHRLARRWHP